MTAVWRRAPDRELFARLIGCHWEREELEGGVAYWLCQKLPMAEAKIQCFFKLDVSLRLSLTTRFVDVFAKAP